MFAEWPLLSLTIWTPILGGIAVLLSGDKGDAEGVRRLALAQAWLDPRVKNDL